MNSPPTPPWLELEEGGMRVSHNLSFAFHRISVTFNNTDLQGSAKRWALGCVNPASRLRLAVGDVFMQLRAHLLAYPCTYLFAFSRKYVNYLK